MSRHLKQDADWVEKRDARILKLWNEGVPASALATRFTLTVPGVQAILRRERASGATVRAGQKAWA